MSEEAVYASTHYGKLCTDSLLVLEDKCRSKQNMCGVKFNIHFFANFLRYITAKNY